MELDDHIPSMINMTGIETDMVSSIEILRIFALNQPYTEITDGGANDSTNDTDIDNDTELIIELPSCVTTVKGG